MINDEDRLYPAESVGSGEECLYYRTLFEIFKVYTTPKLKRVLEANNIKYMVDGKGKPFARREDVYGSRGSETTQTPAAPEEPM